MYMMITDLPGLCTTESSPISSGAVPTVKWYQNSNFAIRYPIAATKLTRIQMTMMNASRGTRLIEWHLMAL